MTQGDLSVMDFGKKMKLAADALREVKNILRDRAVKPRANAAVNLLPSGISAARGNGAVDVMKKPELAAHRLEEGRPLAIVGAVQFQLDGNVRLDVDRSVGVEEEGAC